MSTCATCKNWRRWSCFDRAPEGDVDPARWTKPKRIVEDDQTASDGGPALGECFAARDQEYRSDAPYLAGECRSEGIGGEVVTNGLFGCVLYVKGSAADHTHFYPLRR